MTNDGPFPSFQQWSNPSSFYASLPKAIDGVMSFVLCPDVVFQAPQHFKASKPTTTTQIPFLYSLHIYLFLFVCFQISDLAL